MQLSICIDRAGQSIITAAIWIKLEASPLVCANPATCYKTNPYNALKLTGEEKQRDKIGRGRKYFCDSIL